MRRAHLGILACAVVALAMLPGQADVVVADPPGLVETGPPDLVLPGALITPLQGATINCEFLCNDGIGFALIPCTDGSLGACCANAEPACEDHGGLASGICRKGRLGLPCTPL